MKFFVPLVIYALTNYYTRKPSENLELGEFFEGDMILPKSHTKNGILKKALLWPNRTLPYVFGPRVTELEKLRIKHTLMEFKRTCVEIVERTDQPDYIVVHTDDGIGDSEVKGGCWSHVGRRGGLQDLNLQSGYCIDMYGSILHEFLHALGFYHMQSDPMRDDYVKIHWENIIPGKENYFKTIDSTSFNVGYDYNSVMHYPRNAFSINSRLSTITPINPRRARIGQRKNFSWRDIKKLNILYGCA